MFFINCENSHLITLLIAQKKFLVKIDARAGWGLYLELELNILGYPKNQPD